MHLSFLVSTLCVPPLLLSALALSGWLGGRLELASLLSGSKAMAPLSAMTFATLALGPILARLGQKRFKLAVLGTASFLGLVFSVLALIDLIHGGPGFQSILIPRSMASKLSWPNDGHTSLITAIVLMLISFSLAFQALADWKPFPAASLASCLGLPVALGGLAVLAGFLMGQPLLSGAVSLSSGFSYLALGSAACLGGGKGAWPVRLFIGPSVEARLLRSVIPLTALIALASGTFLSLGPRMVTGLPLASVLFFALFLFLSCMAVFGVSRSFAGFIEGLIQERRQAEDGLAHALDIKERLLGELNHRTRNSLQLVLSMVDLEEMPRGGGASLRDRVGVLALVHDNLVRGDDPSALGAMGLVSGLAAYFDPKGGVEYETQAGNFHLLYDLAAPLAILAAEIDALMRVDLPPRGGRVELDLEPCAGRGCVLSYTASWLPAAAMEHELDFARTVARYQLDGSIAVDEGSTGTTISIKAGECAYERRI